MPPVPQSRSQNDDVVDVNRWRIDLVPKRRKTECGIRSIITQKKSCNVKIHTKRFRKLNFASDVQLLLKSHRDARELSSALNDGSAWIGEQTRSLR